MRWPGCRGSSGRSRGYACWNKSQYGQLAKPSEQTRVLCEPKQTVSAQPHSPSSGAHSWHSDTHRDTGRSIPSGHCPTVSTTAGTGAVPDNECPSTNFRALEAAARRHCLSQSVLRITRCPLHHVPAWRKPPFRVTRYTEGSSGPRLFVLWSPVGWGTQTCYTKKSDLPGHPAFASWVPWARCSRGGCGECFFFGGGLLVAASNARGCGLRGGKGHA